MKQTYLAITSAMISSTGWAHGVPSFALSAIALVAAAIVRAMLDCVILRVVALAPSPDELRYCQCRGTAHSNVASAGCHISSDDQRCESFVHSILDCHPQNTPNPLTVFPMSQPDGNTTNCACHPGPVLQINPKPVSIDRHLMELYLLLQTEAHLSADSVWGTHPCRKAKTASVSHLSYSRHHLLVPIIIMRQHLQKVLLLLLQLLPICSSKFQPHQQKIQSLCFNSAAVPADTAASPNHDDFNTYFTLLGMQSHDKAHEGMEGDGDGSSLGISHRSSIHPSIIWR